MVKECITFYCKICNSEYESYNDAEKCEDRGIPKPRFKVGEITTVKYYRLWAGVPLQKRPVRILEQLCNSHDTTLYKFEFLDVQDKPSQRQKYYYGYDNQDDIGYARMILFKRYRRKK